MPTCEISWSTVSTPHCEWPTRKRSKRIIATRCCAKIRHKRWNAQRLLDLARRDDDLIVTYIEQFNSRLDERRFDLALDAAERSLRRRPQFGRDQRGR